MTITTSSRPVITDAYAVLASTSCFPATKVFSVLAGTCANKCLIFPSFSDRNGQSKLRGKLTIYFYNDLTIKILALCACPTLLNIPARILGGSGGSIDEQRANCSDQGQPWNGKTLVAALREWTVLFTNHLA